MSAQRTLQNTTQSASDTQDHKRQGSSFLIRPRIANLWAQVGLGFHDFNFEVDMRDHKKVRDLTETTFYKYLEQAREMENARVEDVKKRIARGEPLKRPSRRPTDVVYKLLQEHGLERLPGQEILGHIPGVNIGDTFTYRSQIKLVGLHKELERGMSMVKIKKEKKTTPFVASIVVAGGYEDDEDNGDEFVYTGCGGNDRLGTKTQTKDQELTSYNLALLNNAKYCIPVRVIRTNKKEGYSVYDGLYDVKHMVKEKGVKGFTVFKYHMSRCPGQEAAAGLKVEFGGRSKGAAKQNDCVVCLDITKGLESMAIAAVNNVDNMLPPGIKVKDVLEEAKQLKQWEEDQLKFDYITELVYDKAVEVPAPPSPPLCSAHDEVSRLNKLPKGSLPYSEGQLGGVAPMLYECSDYLHCKEKMKCPQRVTQLPIKVQLRLFKTVDRGWAVQSLQRIPEFTFVCVYKGLVLPCTSPQANDNYAYNLCRRTDYDDDGNHVAEDTSVDVKYAITGLKRGNVFRFINHSCDPNCFIQPTLSKHRNDQLPDIALFTLRAIRPFEELTYDYGSEFITHVLGRCRCRTAVCANRRLIVDESADEERVDDEGWKDEPKEELKESKTGEVKKRKRGRGHGWSAKKRSK